MARWLHLPNNTVPLGIPEPDLTIQSDASRTGIGFMINSAKYQMTFEDLMEEYSIKVLELLAIWMATLMIHQENIILRIMTDNSAALSVINKASSSTYHLASITEMINNEVDYFISPHSRILHRDCRSTVSRHHVHDLNSGLF